MQTQVQEAKIRGQDKNKDTTLITLDVSEYGEIAVPGLEGASYGTCFVPVTELPTVFDEFMAVNPRVPNRTKRGVLTGPVSQGILKTLRELPDEMALKNQGLYILADNVSFKGGKLRFTLSDKGKHGLVNGGHTYAAIMEAREGATEEELAQLGEAYVKLNIMSGIPVDFVAELAEGLNRSRQVDDPSLMNLQGEFDAIRRVLKDTPAAQHIAYHQGDRGEVYISEILVYLALFDVDRFTERRQPSGLYNRQALGLKYFQEDVKNKHKSIRQRIQLLPDILWLVDAVRLAVPEAARKGGFQFGRAKVGGDGRAKLQKEIVLPFTEQTTTYRVPAGWVYPIVSAFRANLGQDKDGRLDWRVPLRQLLPDVIEDLAAVCAAEHRSAGDRPELVGKRDSAYSQCYTRVQLYLAKKRLL